MEKTCDDLQAFLDGELDQAATVRFQDHLLRCKSCPERMAEALELDLRLDLVVNGAPVPAPPKQVPSAPAKPQVPPVEVSGKAANDSPEDNVVQPVWPRRWARRAAGAAGVLLAACAALIYTVLPSGVPPEVWLADTPERHIEARVGPSIADRYRRYEVNRSGGARSFPPPAEKVAYLEKKGDYLGIAAAYLVRGYLDEAEHYLDLAKPAADVADVANSQAVIALQRGKLEEALALTEAALKARPEHPQALWNRALVLRELHLSGMAAQSFRQLAALNEPGWSDDARAKAEQLGRDVELRRSSWLDMKRAMGELVETGRSPREDQVVEHRGMTRAFLYEAVRAAPTRERVLALRPLAELLDRLDQGQSLTAYVRWASERDFAQRRPLAETYAQLFQNALPPSAHADFLARLRRSQEQDILLGALVKTDKAAENPDEFRRLAAAARDPWFTLLAEEVHAQAEVNRGEADLAESRLLGALSQCGASTHLELRCGLLEQALAVIDDTLHRPQEARRHAVAMLNRARQINNWSLEMVALQELGQLACHAGKLVLAHAYFEEVLAAQVQPERRCDLEEFIRPLLAGVHQKVLDFQGARAQIDLLARCGRSPNGSHLFALADLARLLPRPEDADVLRRGLEARRKASSLGPGESALLDHIEGRFELERNPGLGQSLLRRAIAGAERAPESDVSARKARVYSYTSLLFEAGKRHAYEEALRLFADELRVAPPSRCALAVTAEDERTLLVLVDSAGFVKGAYDNSREEPLHDVSTLVPKGMVKELEACDAVEVLARPPLQGQPGLLPPELAWAYRVSQGVPEAAPAPRRRLVVTDILIPEELRGKDALPRLDSSLQETSGADVVLREEQATPSRVLQEMRTATEITFNTHGLSDTDVADASFLVLSKDTDGRSRLTALDLQGVQLKARPVVLLAACYAGQTTRFLHEAHGLPTAFIRAGARVVLASTEQIPDREASAFFEPVLSSIRDGKAPAVALRDERRKWLQGHNDSWVKNILLFE